MREKIRHGIDRAVYDGAVDGHTVSDNFGIQRLHSQISTLGRCEDRKIGNDRICCSGAISYDMRTRVVTAAAIDRFTTATAAITQQSRRAASSTDFTVWNN